MIKKIKQKRPANATGRRSVPSPGRLHVPQGNEDCVSQLLNPPAPTTEALEPRAHAPQQEESLRWEARAPPLETSPPPPQLEKALVQQQRRSAANNE